jgi:hypothetical protein
MASVCLLSPLDEVMRVIGLPLTEGLCFPSFETPAPSTVGGRVLAVPTRAKPSYPHAKSADRPHHNMYVSQVVAGMVVWGSTWTSHAVLGPGFSAGLMAIHGMAPRVKLC